MEPAYGEQETVILTILLIPLTLAQQPADTLGPGEVEGENLLVLLPLAPLSGILATVPAASVRSTLGWLLSIYLGGRGTSTVQIPDRPDCDDL